MTELNISALSSLVSILMLAGFVYLYKQHQLEVYRQRLFALRDMLFDAAADGRLSFDDRAYQIVRTLINGNIRFAERSSFIPTIAFLVLSKDLDKVGGKLFTEQLKESLEGMTEEQRQLIEDVRMQLHLHHIVYIVHSSLILRATVKALSFFGSLRERITKVIPVKYGREIDRLDAAAYAEG